MARLKIIYLAKKNGRSSKQFADSYKINVKRVVRLLQDSSIKNRHPAIRRAANALLEILAKGRWRVSAGPHKGGKGDHRGIDQTKHITVFVEDERTSYHLRLDSRGHLFQITGKGLPGTKPWIAI